MEDYSSSRLNISPHPPVPAVAKAVRVLQQVAAAPEPIGVSEIARRCELGKSTVHNLVGALVSERFLAMTEGTRGYVLGPALISLGTRARDQELQSAAEPVLRQLSEDTGETALLGLLSRDRVTILAKAERRQALNLSAPIGTSVPVVAGALGKVFVAGMAPDDAGAYLESTPMPRYTERSITARDRYTYELGRVRASGYATERGEYLPGIAAAAASFRWLGSTYFVWVVGIEANASDDQLDAMGALVAEAARTIDGALTPAGLARSAS